MNTPAFPDDGGFYDRISVVLKAMSDPLRLKLLHCLKLGERCVSDLVDQAGGCSQANVSKHLAVLRTAGLVKVRREGLNSYYSIADPIVFQICDAVCDCLRRQVDKDSALLDSLRSQAG
jgi:DNA-binding transcriptional ArsR family regulator